MKRLSLLWYNVDRFEATQIVSTDLKAVLIIIRWQLEPPDNKKNETPRNNVV